VTIDTTITLGNLLTIAGMIVTALCAWFLLRGDVVANKADLVELKARLDASGKTVEALKDRVEQVRARGAKELADYQLLVANEYATHAAIKEVEQRVVEAINRLGDRFDNYFDRSPSGGRRRGGSPHNG
jgi:hypothetical protein